MSSSSSWRFQRRRLDATRRKASLAGSRPSCKPCGSPTKKNARFEATFEARQRSRFFQARWEYSIMRMLGVDVGGTFIDVVCYDDERSELKWAKASSSPANPAAGVLAALERGNIDLREID